MKYFILIVICVLFTLSMCNRKVNVFKIIGKQFKVYRNDKVGKISKYDLLSFVISPILLSTLMIFVVDLEFIKSKSETIITILSIVATILLSFLTLLIDKKNISSNEKIKQVSSETYITIIMTTLFSLFAITILIIQAFLPNVLWMMQICNVFVYFCLIKILLNILMILKRMFLILDD